jgi:hypothetical protein
MVQNGFAAQDNTIDYGEGYKNENGSVILSLQILETPLITNVLSTCSCTVPTTRRPIMPGKRKNNGKIQYGSWSIRKT